MNELLSQKEQRLGEIDAALTAIAEREAALSLKLRALCAEQERRQAEMRRLLLGSGERARERYEDLAHDCAAADRGKPGLSGVHLEPEALVIDGLGPLKNERHRESWERFFQALDRMAKTQKRVIPETPCSDNEKYLFFTLLQRAGMKGEAYKADRKRLMERISGQSGVKECATELCK